MMEDWLQTPASDIDFVVGHTMAHSRDWCAQMGIPRHKAVPLERFGRQLEGTRGARVVLLGLIELEDLAHREPIYVHPDSVVPNC